VQLEDERTKADQLMDILMRDEEVRNILFRKVKDLYADA
jgi:hypothetical protein